MKINLVLIIVACMLACGPQKETNTNTGGGVWETIVESAKNPQTQYAAIRTIVRDQKRRQERSIQGHIDRQDWDNALKRVGDTAAIGQALAQFETRLFLGIKDGSTQTEWTNALYDVADRIENGDIAAGFYTVIDAIGDRAPAGILAGMTKKPPIADWPRWKHEWIAAINTAKQHARAVTLAKPTPKEVPKPIPKNQLLFQRFR